MTIAENVILSILSFLIVTIGALLGLLYRINDKRINRVESTSSINTQNTDGKIEELKKVQDIKNKELHDMIHDEVDKTRMELSMHQNKVDTSFREVWDHLNKFTADTRESLGKIVVIVETMSNTEKRLETRMENMETKIERKIDQLKESLPKRKSDIN